MSGFSHSSRLANLARDAGLKDARVLQSMFIFKPPLIGGKVLWHGRLPHASEYNRSDRRRHAYILHAIDGACAYLPDNWLQRRPDLPLKGFQ